MLCSSHVAEGQRVRLPTGQVQGQVVQGPPPAASTPPSLLPNSNQIPGGGLSGPAFNSNGPVIYGQPQIVGQPQIRIGAPIAAPAQESIRFKP